MQFVVMMTRLVAKGRDEMTKDHLLELLDKSAKNVRWIQRQILTARFLRADLAKKMGIQAARNEEPIALPQDEEIVSETFVRVRDSYNERYIWDGSKPATFDKFFARCLKTTLNSLRAAERSQRVGKVNVELKLGVLRGFTLHEHVTLTNETVDQGKSAPVLAAAIAKTRIRGTTKQYVERLHRYALLKSTTEEIANDLGVKPSSVESYRKRIRRVMEDDEK